MDKIASIFSFDRLWLFLFFSNVLCVVVLVFLFSRINEERIAAVARGDIFALGYQLGKYSDFLTMETQAFAVTGDVEHLINYWKEIEVDQNREKIIRRLKEYGVADQESHLLIESKRNSDELVQTEIRSMRLVLSAYNIPRDLYPDAVKDFHLIPSDEARSPAEKIQLAQDIVFDEEYRINKAKIMDPITLFNDNIARNIQMSILAKRETTNWVLYLIIAVFSFNSLIIIGTIWLKRSVLTK